MSIPAIGGVTTVLPTTYLSGATGTDATSSGDGAGFASVLGSIDSLQQLQSTSNQLAVQAVTGDLDDVHDYTVAAAEASLTLELTAALRNKAIDAFSEIMRMQA
ncbi:flagellar hook-basal body complex protein FliE [Cellulomonas sp. P22]|uniref:flagellar hook-basal body complex protein FliE n=1 Tax=Cellulomonas sp. P22 TaxID=3373189 RepID=UPI0037AA3AC2